MTSAPKILLLYAALLFCCSQTQQQAVESPFEYRDVYLPELPFDEGAALQLNSVDRDWGIWGHNLSVVLPRNPSPSVFAKSGNSINDEQFCFTSDALFDYIKEYIENNYGHDIPARFAILPNDNAVVCQCSRCRECGNTKGDASGAVYYLLERLTGAFPRHLFFTSYYSTTRSLPQKPLPENAGVLISAMSYPLSAVHTPQEDAFESLLTRWAEVTDHVYVWDYINNFDDYFTPVPVFDVVQRRLQLYARAGVNGVFFNGSGPEYSTLSRLKTHVIAAMLRDPDMEWRPILKDLCSELYPVAGGAISDFMIRQEDMFKAGGRSIPLYEGVAVASKTYLPVPEFIQFHSELLAVMPDIKDPELTEIERMRCAMMFTRLELNRISADTVGCSMMLDGLERLTGQGILTYSESGGSIDSYISDYRFMLARYRENGNRNLLKGARLRPLTVLDEDYNDISVLTDGLLGLPSSYHCGQLLSSADPALRIAVPNEKGMRHLRVNMTRNPIYHIALPLSVSLTCDGRDLGRKVPRTTAGNLNRATVEFDIPSDCKGTLILTVVRDKNERTMALDEIEGFR